MQRIPVILDTDIGDDIDDTWALTMLLKSPKLDLKLVNTAYNNTPARATIVAKLLDRAGRTDIPIGIGKKTGDNIGYQLTWVDDYEMARYPGTVHADGVSALIRTIMDSPEPVTIIAIGPLCNISAALQQEPAIARRARFVGMHGSVRRGYDGSAEISKEWNIVADVPAAQRVFTAAWNSMTITPLDTCGLVRLTSERYQTVKHCQDPLTAAMMENYHVWSRGVAAGVYFYNERAALAGDTGDTSRDGDWVNRSSVLFDTVAVYLAFSQSLLEMAPLGIRVTDDGFTVIDDTAPVINCAVNWKDLPAFEDLLVTHLLAKTQSASVAL